MKFTGNARHEADTSAPDAGERTHDGAQARATAPPASPRHVAAREMLDLEALPHILTRILKMAAQERGRLACAVAASIAGTLFAVLMPHLLGQAVDETHLLMKRGTDSAQAFEALLFTGLLLVAASALRGLLTMTSGYGFERIGQTIAYRLRLAFFDKLQRLDFAFHDRIHSGDLISRGMLDLEGIRMFVENGLQRIVSLALLLGLGATAMILLDPFMAVLALSFVPFVIWRAIRTGLLLRFTWTRLQQRMSVLTRIIEENLQGIRVVRAFAAKRLELGKFDDAAVGALHLATQRFTIRSGAVATMTLAFYGAMALVLWVGGNRVAGGTMSVGQLTAFLAFMTILQQPVRQVMIVVNTVARAVSSGSRLFEILDRPPAIAGQPGAPALIAGGALRFEQVGFGYGGRQEVVLADISFEIPPGHTLGIVGPPGSGKSTLAHLIPRFYDVSEGRITIGGQDIRDITLASLRSEVVLVQQDVFLFDSSIADNVAYSDPPAEDHAIELAARRAQLHDHVEALPLRYATLTGERGVGLSGGQRQRLSIARGIIGEPAILILDDCTSALDTATERRLRTSLRELARERITIIISHRLGTLSHADEIILLDHGRIAERGTHQALLRLGGRYAQLHAMQAGGAGAGAVS